MSWFTVSKADPLGSHLQFFKDQEFLCNEWMIWMASPKTKLLLIKKIKFFKTIDSPFINNLLKLLIDVLQKTDCLIIAYFEFWSFFENYYHYSKLRQSEWVPVFIHKLKILLKGIDIPFFSICNTCISMLYRSEVLSSYSNEIDIQGICMNLVAGVSDISDMSSFFRAFASLVYFRQCQENKN